MCQFKSGVILENGTLLHSLDTDSHEDIIEANNLQDDGIRDNFVRLEMVPNINLIEAVNKINLKVWSLKIDQDNIPKWFNKPYAEKKMFEALKETIKKRVLKANKSIGKIEDGERWILVCGKIEYVSGSAVIKSVSGSAVINNVSGSAVIKNVSGSAVINNVSGSAVIEYVYGSAVINNVSGSAVILISRENGKLKIRTALEVDVIK